MADTQANQAIPDFKCRGPMPVQSVWDLAMVMQVSHRAAKSFGAIMATGPVFIEHQARTRHLSN